MEKGGVVEQMGTTENGYYRHATAIIDPGATIGEGTKIWHFCHVMGSATIGRDCILGQNSFVGEQCTIGNRVKIQNNVSIYQGVDLEDDVFCGPSMVFTNVRNPRAHVERKEAFERTHVGRGATLGANCTVVCGNKIGRFATVAAGAVVTSDVPDYALVMGVPARPAGWMCACGERLASAAESTPAVLSCSECGQAYVLGDKGLCPESATA
jgi:UDP-2-acetamido-3-amino-2,3-dideoxy-glucuronate N-acetyltransferase